MGGGVPAGAAAHRPPRVLARARQVSPAVAGADPAGGARVALVHDWLTGMRGGERCLEVLCELFPEAPLFTLLHVPGSVTPLIENRRIVTSFVQHLPRAAARYRYYLPAFPLAISRFDLSGYDLVVSLSHCVAKGVRVAPRALHVCYCFSPMRYVWDLYDDYFGPGRGAATRLARRPVVVGPGPEEARLRAIAGPTVTFLGWRSDAEVAGLYARCRALLFPAVEDFGIAPLEAAAAGRPTIALARGGALETMVGLGTPDRAPTAVFFSEQSVDALVEAIARFEGAAERFDGKALRARAESFDRPVFKQRLRDYIGARWHEFHARPAC